MEKSDFGCNTQKLEDLLARVIPDAIRAMEQYRRSCSHATLMSEWSSPSEFNSVLACIMEAVYAWEDVAFKYRIGSLLNVEKSEAYAALKTAELRRLLGDQHAFVDRRWEEYARVAGLGNMPYPRRSK